MSSSPSNTWKIAALVGAGLILAVAVCGGLAAWTFLSGDDPAPSAEPAGPWKTDSNAPEVSLRLSPANGPEILAQDGALIEQLGLQWVGEYGEAEGEAGCKAAGTCLLMEDAALTWVHEEHGAAHHFVGTHDGKRARVTATWVVEAGSPLITLTVDAEWKVDSHPDREALVLSTRRPVSALGRDLSLKPVTSGNRMFADATTPHLATLGTGASLPVQLQAWGFQGMEVAAANGVTKLTLEVDDARNHPFRPAADCTSDRGRRDRLARDRRTRQAGEKQRWHATLQVGDGWAPAPWRNPAGFAGALAVVDAAPGSSARRLRTLLWGHSDTKDPRYGNGGFLGHHLSITKGIHTGPRGMGSSRFAETVRRAAGTGVKFANQSASAEEDEPSLNEAGMDILATVDAKVWVDAGDGCEDFFGNGWRKGRLAEPLAEHGYAWIWSAQDAPWTPGAGLNQLRPGRRSLRPNIFWQHDAARHDFGFFAALDLSFGKQRVVRALSENQLNRLVTERGVSVVRTTFDRTTVAGSQAESGMIVREDDGHYVLDGELEKVLFDMEDLSGRGQLWVTTVEELGQRYRQLRDVRVLPTADGRIAVTNHGKDKLVDWSAVVPGTVVNIDGSPPKGSRLYGELNVVWFDLPPETTVYIESRDTDGKLVAPAAPVRWSVTGPAAAAAHADAR